MSHSSFSRACGYVENNPGALLVGERIDQPQSLGPFRREHPPRAVENYRGKRHPVFLLASGFFFTIQLLDY